MPPWSLTARNSSPPPLPMHSGARHPPPAFGWSVSGGGTIDANGLFTAGGSVGGPFTVTASNGNVTGTATISIAPT